MNKRLFSILAVLTLIAIGAAWLIPGSRDSGPANQSSVLIEGLADQVNDIDWVRLEGAGGEVVATLQRSQAGWSVTEADGYGADWNRLRGLLRDLAEAQVVEAKTANPDYYARLGVEDTADESAQGVKISFHPETGLPAVILGNEAQGRGGQYARLADSSASALLDRSVDVADERRDWLLRDVVDIAEADVVEVSIVHPDGEQVKLLKVSADDSDFNLQGIPEGREVKSAYTVNALAGALVSLQLDEVRRSETEAPVDAVQYRSLTADGLEIEATWLVESAADDGEDRHWVRIAASGNERAADINARVSGWEYQVPRYKFDAASKRMDDLLNPVEAD